ncbi:TPA: hypothetical protein ACGOYX_001003 [Streptococcus suis]
MEPLFTRLILTPLSQRLGDSGVMLCPCLELFDYCLCFDKKSNDDEGHHSLSAQK